jgi:hypothetical protein
MSVTPIRVRRSRAKGARLPENTVCVDRSTKWGNPFVVGEHGTRAECVDLFKTLMHGYICVSCGIAPNLLMAYRAMVASQRHELRGKNLACWCGAGPCHADVLLEVAAMAPAAPVGPIRLPVIVGDGTLHQQATLSPEPKSEGAARS